MIHYLRQAKPYVKAIFNLALFAAGAAVCFLIIPKLLLFFMPFVIGWIIASIANPLVRFFEKRIKIKRKAGSAVVIVAVLAIVILVGYTACAWLLEELILFIQEIPNMWAGAQADLLVMEARLSVFIQYLPNDIRKLLDSFQENIMEYVGMLASSISSPTFEAIGRFAKNIPSIAIGIIMGLLSSYFFVAERDTINNLLPKILPGFVMKRWIIIKKGISTAIGGYFKAQLKIELWIYIMLVIGFLVLDIQYAIFIAIGIALLDILPIFGAGLILLPWAFIKFINTDYKMFIGLLIIWGASQLVRQIIQPKIVGDSMGMPPIPTLFLLFLGFRFAGFFGMIIAVPVGIVIKNLYEEGAFETTKTSLRVLFYGINNFRRFDKDDLEQVDRYHTSQNDK